ncbi:hypothetical protein [Microbulbifer aggregans]|uniref:hypothetical protein n=1 Tax=Microbulbifer aggregans TaxID=1769779 RepID=UPI001CFD3F1A|nr:hypothetical protein [Microbulbifer aggregans]
MHILFILFWVLIFALRAYNSSEHKGQKASSQARILGFFVWVLAVITFLIFRPYDNPGSVAALVAIVFFLFPSIWIKAPIAAGWIIPSYYLSFLILRVNGHAIRAGAAFNGYRALLRKPHISAEKRKKILSWLLRKIEREKGRITSGDMLLHAVLNTDGAPDELERQLDTLFYLRKECVPLPMVRFCFARLLAQALGEQDWKKVASISNKWRKKWRLPLATLIELSYHRHMKTRRVDPFSYFFLWLECGCPRWLSQLPFSKATEDAAGDRGDPAELKPRLVQSALTGKLLDPEIGSANILLSPDQLAAWKSRAQTLHCRNPEAAIAKIEQSLTAACENSPLSTAMSTPGDDALNRLRYQARSIYRRQASKQLQAGSVEFQEWLNFVSAYEQLASDKNDRYEAYSLVEGVIWNWMADLWNIKKERHLAFMICGYMNPHAQEFGSEAGQVYKQVLEGKLG